MSRGLLEETATAGPLAAVARLRKGLPYQAVERFQRTSQLPWESIRRVMRISPRTLARRRSAGKLTPEKSERLFRLCRIFEQTVALFDGDKAAARTWLQSPNRALDQQSPLVLAESEIGAGEVEALIGRLEHGVFS